MTNPEHVRYNPKTGEPYLVTAVQYRMWNANEIIDMALAGNAEACNYITGEGQPIWIGTPAPQVIRLGDWLIVTPTGDVLVEDQEPKRAEWEWGTAYDLDADTTDYEDAPSKEQARRIVSDSPTDTGLVRRLRAGTPGPWEQTP